MNPLTALESAACAALTGKRRCVRGLAMTVTTSLSPMQDLAILVKAEQLALVPPLVHIRHCCDRCRGLIIMGRGTEQYEPQAVS